MPMPASYPFTRYLAAKKPIDDRALNAGVWARLEAELRRSPRSRPLNVLEVGAGIGTMVERALERELFSGDVHYLLLDDQLINLTEARRRLPAWASRHGWSADWIDDHLEMSTDGQSITVEFVQADALAFAKQEVASFDLLIAHAFLDLVHLPTALPVLLSTLRPGGLFLFTLNFDGVTAFEPVIDLVLDAHIEALYHADMDARLIDGQCSGDSRSGRHLFEQCWAAGAEVLAGGGSDWVVFPVGDCYPGDEAFFLHAIINFIKEALREHPDLNKDVFVQWIDRRHAQVDAAELVYIAHQLDLVGRRFG